RCASGASSLRGQSRASAERPHPRGGAEAGAREIFGSISFPPARRFAAETSWPWAPGAPRRSSRATRPRCFLRRPPVARGGVRKRRLVVTPACGSGRGGSSIRSEEHTSELQSRFDLVCRLL